MNPQRRRQTLDAWIREAVNDTDKDGPCTMISVCHMAGITPQEIHTVKLGAGRAWAEGELARLFTGKAESYSQDLPGVQTFVLLAFYGGRSEPESRHPFTISGEQNDIGLMTEAPDARGMTQQGMRHVEAIVGLAFQQTRAMAQANATMIETLSSKLMHLVDEHFEAIKIVKELVLEKENEQYEREMKKLEYERSTAERKQIISFIPALANTILGREVFPQATEDTAIIEGIADALPEEDLKKLLMISPMLPPVVQGIFASRMERFLRGKREAKEAKTALAVRSNPEDELQ